MLPKGLVVPCQRLELAEFGRRDVVQLLLPLPIVGTYLGQLSLEGRRVVELLEVRQLVQDFRYERVGEWNRVTMRREGNGRS